MLNTAIIVALFVTAALAAFVVARGLLAMLFRPRQAAAEPSEAEAARGPLFGSWTNAIGALAPMRADAIPEMQKALLKAGYYYPSALADFRAVRSLLTFLPLLLALEVALLWDDQIAMLFAVGYGLIASVVGFALPRLYVNRQGEQRSQQIKKALPRALDLLSLCLTAGVNLIAAFEYVGRQLVPTHPVLAGEMLLTHRQAELRSLGHALMCCIDRGHG